MEIVMFCGIQPVEGFSKFNFIREPAGHEPIFIRAWIAQACSFLEITTTELSKLAHVSPSMINRFMKDADGRRNLTATTIAAISEAIVSRSPRRTTTMAASSKLLTVTEVAAVAKINPRSIQNWAASGVVWAEMNTDRKGTGWARLFNERETKIAVFLAKLMSCAGLTIGQLNRIAMALRANRDHVKFLSMTSEDVAVNERLPNGITIYFS
jgi:DNA-binding transcriptional MerR regulator